MSIFDRSDIGELILGELGWVGDVAHEVIIPEPFPETKQRPHLVSQS